MSNKRISELVIQAYQALDQGSYDEAQQNFNKILVLDSNNYDAHKGIMIIYHDTEQFDRSIEIADSLISIDPDDLEVFLYKANCFNALEHFDESSELFNHILEKEPANPQALHGRSIVKVYQEDIDGALDDIEKSIDGGNRNEYSLNHRGVINLTLGNYEKSLEDFARGATFSYYEFVEDKIYNDEEWRKRNKNRSLPDRPEWIAPLINKITPLEGQMEYRYAGYWEEGY
ncbi:MAG: tetratricopeptide repeat protein [Bacteroidota bacterium]